MTAHFPFISCFLYAALTCISNLPKSMLFEPVSMCKCYNAVSKFTKIAIFRSVRGVGSFWLVETRLLHNLDILSAMCHVPCCAMHCRSLPQHAVLWGAMPWHSMCHCMPCCAMPYNATPGGGARMQHFCVLVCMCYFVFYKGQHGLLLHGEVELRKCKGIVYHIIFLGQPLLLLLL